VGRLARINVFFQTVLLYDLYEKLYVADLYIFIKYNNVFVNLFYSNIKYNIIIQIQNISIIFVGIRTIILRGNVIRKHWWMYDLERILTKFEIISRAYMHRYQFPICLAYAITINKSGIKFAKCFVRCWQFNILVWSSIRGPLQSDEPPDSSLN
jgi:hypothetical protein